MPNVPSIPDPLGEFAKELAKQLPVKEIYEDGGQPAVRQSGMIAADLVKTLHLALAPIQYLGALQDRFRDFLDKSVRAVPEERRIAPAPQILGPVIEGIRYETEGSDIEKMFSELLTSAMDSEKVKYAHPAIALLLRQLSSDEVKLLATIATAKTPFEFVTRFNLSEDNMLALTVVESYGLPTVGLMFPNNINLYAERFEKLGLIKLDTHKPMEQLSNGMKQTGGRNFAIYKFTAFGTAFMKACGKNPII